MNSSSRVTVAAQREISPERPISPPPSPPPLSSLSLSRLLPLNPSRHHPPSTAPPRTHLPSGSGAGRPVRADGGAPLEGKGRQRRRWPPSPLRHRPLSSPSLLPHPSLSPADEPRRQEPLTQLQAGAPEPEGRGADRAWAAAKAGRGRGRWTRRRRGRGRRLRRHHRRLHPPRGHPPPPRPVVQQEEEEGAVPRSGADGVAVLRLHTVACSEFPKTRIWKEWEKDTSSIAYEFSADPSKFRLTHQTSFVRQHASCWSKSTIMLYVPRWTLLVIF